MGFFDLFKKKEKGILGKIEIPYKKKTMYKWSKVVKLFEQDVEVTTENENHRFVIREFVPYINQGLDDLYKTNVLESFDQWIYQNLNHSEGFIIIPENGVAIHRESIKKIKLIILVVVS